MEKGLQSYFFGKTGEITKRFAFLRKEVWKNEKRKQENLAKKIDTGQLTYYFLKENEDTYKKRVNEIKKHKLIISTNYHVKEDKDLNLEQLKLIDQLANYTYDSTNIHNSNHNKKRNLLKQIVIENNKIKRNLIPSHAEKQHKTISLIEATPIRSRNNNIRLLNTDSGTQYKIETTVSVHTLRKKKYETTKKKT